MRIGTVTLIVTSALWLTPAAPAQDRRPQGAVSYALRYFDDLPRGGADAALRAIRTEPLTPRARNLIRASLPTSGELVPSPIEQRKLDALQTILIYHDRQQVFDIKLIDVPQAFVGLHGRAILLISRPALNLLSALELQALAAHEVGHDFLWARFEHAQRSRERLVRQQLELQCDGIAVLTLVAVGEDPMRLLTALKKLQRFNERRGAVLNLDSYPTLRDRERLVATLVGHR